ncbi:putative glycoside hydrolase [Coraliomargarita algicola]|uniref:Glycoside hydrolase n=1 Tax=Coraliomargarita algicola TaxID=3092156 RepID=A0ABZ0RPG8_9BACT|nr:putative glycoside hydrolase [Coraliomargarita sp. J2-16]WPJ97013.1 putative glycoside hydrolase [Coraliomargarita sp. J2-16]
MKTSDLRFMMAGALCFLASFLLSSNAFAMTPEEMMSYLPKHLEKISPYSWETPQRWLYLRKRGEFTDREIDIICQASKVIGVSGSLEKFTARYPDRLYGVGYMNLEKDYGSMNLKKGHFATHPEHYLYHADGTPVVGGDCPYYNLLEPGMRDWWMSQARKQIQNGEGQSFFIDALVKALDCGRRGGKRVNFKGELVAKDYRDQGLKPLLAACRDEFADEVVLTGNFLRVNRPGGNMQYVNDYIHCAYIESFERMGGGYVKNAHKGIAYIQEAVKAGKMIRLTMSDRKPTPVPELSLAQKQEKARAAMPEFWNKLKPKEQNELAEIYAYFDFKLAIFLIAAGEHSYFKYAVEPLANHAGTDLFKNVQPFPEWTMPLGAPLEDGKRRGDVWRRKFEHVEVILDLGNGSCEFLKR